MAKKDCTTCKHVEWKTTPTGRRKLDHAADCTVVVVLPNSYIDHFRQLPKPRRVTKYTKPDCALWEKKVCAK